ncbi:MAG: GntR family transcriptional regulator [Chloroflexi bacterium]|nr:GntR family transcriptional regulator [Chloroflexota bacterium]
MSLEALGNLGAEHITLSEAVYRAIREAITDQRLAPGRQLRSADLSDALGVSRTPINEALFRLRQEGLVAYSERHGFSVVEVSPEELPALFDARLMCEIYAIHKGLPRATEADLAAIQSRHKRLEELSQGSPSVLEWFKADYAFHESIVTLAKNPLTLQWYERVNAMIQSRRLPTYNKRQAVDAADALVGHRAILEALEKRDVMAATEASRQHVEEGLGRVQAYIKG